MTGVGDPGNSNKERRVVLLRGESTLVSPLQLRDFIFRVDGFVTPVLACPLCGGALVSVFDLPDTTIIRLPSGIAGYRFPHTSRRCCGGHVVQLDGDNTATTSQFAQFSAVVSWLTTSPATASLMRPGHVGSNPKCANVHMEGWQWGNLQWRHRIPLAG